MEKHAGSVNRRQFMHCCVAAVLCAGQRAYGQAAPGKQPNIVFVYTDDQASWSVGALGGPDAHTPNMNRLFNEGAVCRNSFVTTPVCSPSRVGLIASRYGTEMGITDWISPTGGRNRRDESMLGLDSATPTWVAALRDAGYATGVVGKWHLGTQDEFHPQHFGYDHFAGFRSGGAPVKDPELEIDGEVQTVEGLTVDLITDEALDFIRENAGEQPFMLSLHYRSPHAPWNPVAEDDDAPYDGKGLTIPNPDYPDLDTDRVERLMGEYLSSVTGVDRNLGRVLDLLDDLDLADNTVVVFTSDHGYNVGHHGILHKGNASWITNAARELEGIDPRTKRPNMYDTSLRVPTAVRWPGVIEPGTEVTRCVTNLDWYPTLLAMAGVTATPDSIHGRNFLLLLRGEDIPWDDAFYGEYSMHHYVEADMRMWRTPEWKLMRDFKNDGKDELYHLAEDPGETTNLIDDPAYKEQYEALNAKLIAKMEAIGDPVLKAVAQ